MTPSTSTSVPAVQVDVSSELYVGGHSVSEPVVELCAFPNEGDAGDKEVGEVLGNIVGCV